MLNETQKQLLKYICDETEKSGFANVSAQFAKDAEFLEKAGYADIDPAGADAAGNVRVAATENGADFLKPNAAPFFAPENKLDLEPSNEPAIQTTGFILPNAPFPEKQPDNAKPIVGFTLPSSPVETVEQATNVVSPPVWARPSPAPSFPSPIVSSPVAPAVPPAREVSFTAPPPVQTPVASTAPSVRIVEGVAPPAPKERRKRISANEFPFDQLDVGKAFYIEPTESVPEPEKKYYSLVRSQNIKHQIGVTDAEGNPVMEMRTKNKTINGVKTSIQVQRPIVTQEREFAIYAAKDVIGSVPQTGAYVFRIK